MANAIRALAMDAVEKARSGHPGMPMGTADVATVLFTRYLKFDPSHPEWPDRDRFVLSAGHGSMLLYALLHLTGYPDMTMQEIRNFRQLGSRTAGHPEYGHAAGIETTTGPLGQGFANAVGMALAEEILAARFGRTLVDHRTYVLAGDGDLMEGINHEAAALAGHLRLNRLIVLFDDNKITIDGPISLSASDDVYARYRSYGWVAESIDGHDPAAIAASLERAQTSDRPSLIGCRTVIAYGAPTKAGTAGAHGSPLGEKEIAGTREKLGWPHAPFTVPETALAAWRQAGARSRAAHAEWTQRVAAISPAEQKELQRRIKNELPEDWQKAILAHKRKLVEAPPNMATRQHSGLALAALVPLLPELIGGSADLTGSVATKVAGLEPIQAGKFGGRYVYYGVREHAMASMMNGMALHGGIIPYGGTFLVFSDYCRPAIRLAAIMRQRVIHVMTHDSIGLGEDGPTHQPVEHLAALRAIPNLHVFRPADAVETAECWELAVGASQTPSVLSLTRQNVPHLRTAHTDENLCARGGYELLPANGKARVTLLASGSEVSLAVEARTKLEAQGIATRVVSMPCFDLFEAQSEAYRLATLGPGTFKVAVEAALRAGWDRYIGPEGGFVGMTGFGGSAPASELYKHFGITVEAVVEAARRGNAPHTH
jgi:transketolase